MASPMGRQRDEVAAGCADGRTSRDVAADEHEHADDGDGDDHEGVHGIAAQRHGGARAEHGAGRRHQRRHERGRATSSLPPR